jgi:MFS family permease
MEGKDEVQQVETTPQHHPKHVQPNIVPLEQEAVEDVTHVNLSWRSWLVVFVTCFAIMSQVFVVVAAGSVISFIIRDLGEPAIAGWVIQGPLLMQSVLSPLVGRLSDVLDRKYLASMPPLIACVGAIICAKATSMNMLIGGGILIGITLASISIVQSIPSEILPMKYRALANGFAFVGGAVGGLFVPLAPLQPNDTDMIYSVGGLAAGAVTNVDPAGWRNIFWIQAALHGFTSFGLLACYWPKKRSDYPKMTLKEIIWACDPIGSFLFVIAATLTLLVLNWAGGRYKWGSAHVAAPLSVGLVLLVLFCIYGKWASFHFLSFQHFR